MLRVKMALLPGGNQAIVELEKLTGYVLNSAHPTGKHKARVFAAALGVTPDDAEWLRGVLLQAAKTNQAVPGEPTAFGRRYIIDVMMTGRNGPVTLRSAWLIRRGEAVPRLTTCFVHR